MKSQTERNDPLVSVVILSWNRKDDIFHTLSELRKQTYPDIEIIVVDNNSTDGTCEMVEDRFPEVKLIKLPRNIGIEGYNIGFKNAKGEYIVVLDDDSYLEKDAIEKMISYFRENDNLGAIAFNIYKVTGNKEKILQDRYGLTKVGTEFQVQSIIGSGAGFRADVLRKVGYYSPTFFLYENDADLSIKIYLEGYELKYCEDIIAYHKFSPSNRSSWRKKYYGQRNNLLMIYKYAPRCLKMEALFLKIASLLFNLLLFKFKDAKLSFKILYDSWKLRKQYYEEYKFDKSRKKEIVERFNLFFQWISIRKILESQWK